MIPPHHINGMIEAARICNDKITSLMDQVPTADKHQRYDIQIEAQAIKSCVREITEKIREYIDQNKIACDTIEDES